MFLQQRRRNIRWQFFKKIILKGDTVKETEKMLEKDD